MTERNLTVRESEVKITLVIWPGLENQVLGILKGYRSAVITPNVMGSLERSRRNQYQGGSRNLKNVPD